MRLHRAGQPLPQAGSRRTLQHASGGLGQRPRSIHLAAANPSKSTGSDHKQGGGTSPLVSGLLPLPRDEVARFPPDWQFGATAAGAGRGKWDRRGPRTPLPAARQRSPAGRPIAAGTFDDTGRKPLRRAGRRRPATKAEGGVGRCPAATRSLVGFRGKCKAQTGALGDDRRYGCLSWIELCGG